MVTSAQLVIAAGGGQVAGEVAEDPQPGLQGDVAERAAACPAGAVLLGELAVVERGDRAGELRRDGVQVALPPGGGAAAGLVAGQDQPLAGEEPGQRPAVRSRGPVRSRGGGQRSAGARRRSRRTAPGRRGARSRRRRRDGSGRRRTRSAPATRAGRLAAGPPARRRNGRASPGRRACSGCTARGRRCGRSFPHWRQVMVFAGLAGPAGRSQIAHMPAGRRCRTRLQRGQGRLSAARAAFR